jgi:hypothetical protein
MMRRASEEMTDKERHARIRSNSRCLADLGFPVQSWRPWETRRPHPSANDDPLPPPSIIDVRRPMHNLKPHVLIHYNEVTVCVWGRGQYIYWGFLPLCSGNKHQEERVRSTFVANWQGCGDKHTVAARMAQV